MKHRGLLADEVPARHKFRQAGLVRFRSQPQISRKLPDLQQVLKPPASPPIPARTQILEDRGQAGFRNIYSYHCVEAREDGGLGSAGCRVQEGSDLAPAHMIPPRVPESAWMAA